MPTIDELRTYLAYIGITPPDFMLQAWLDAVADMQACLDEHYPASLAKLKCRQSSRPWTKRKFKRGKAIAQWAI